MKKLSFALCSLALAGVSHAAPAPHEKAVSELRTLVTTFTESIAEKRREPFIDLFLNQHVPWIGVFDDAAAKRIALQQPTWGRVIPYANDTYLSFIDDISMRKERVEEKMSNVKIETDGEIATVLADYTFNVGGQLKNWGKESWHLLHTDAGWKISSVIYSVTFAPEQKAAVEKALKPHLVIDAPASGETQEGAAIIRFHTEGLTIDPEFGDRAAAQMPALGHLHVTVDDLPLLWVYTSKEPIVLASLKPGPHKVRLDLANPNHKVLESQEVAFMMK